MSPTRDAELNVAHVLLELFPVGCLVVVAEAHDACSGNAQDQVANKNTQVFSGALPDQDRPGKSAGEQAAEQATTCPPFRASPHGRCTHFARAVRRPPQKRSRKRPETPLPDDRGHERGRASPLFHAIAGGRSCARPGGNDRGGSLARDVYLALVLSVSGQRSEP